MMALSMGTSLLQMSLDKRSNETRTNNVTIINGFIRKENFDNEASASLNNNINNNLES